MTRCPAFRRSGNFCPWNDDEKEDVPPAPIMTSGPTTRLRELVNAPGNDAPDCIAQSATTPRGRSRAALDAARASATVIRKRQGFDHRRTVHRRDGSGSPAPRASGGIRLCPTAGLCLGVRTLARAPRPTRRGRWIVHRHSGNNGQPLLPFRSAARASSRQHQRRRCELVGVFLAGLGNTRFGLAKRTRTAIRVQSRARISTKR